VECLADDLVADLDEGLVERDEVTDLDEALHAIDGKSHVDEKVLHFGDLLAILVTGNMDRAPAGVHRGDVISAGRGNEHAAGKEVAGVEPTRGVESQESLVVDSLDVEADLVHVAEEHHLGG